MQLLYLACASCVILVHTARAVCPPVVCPQCYYGEVMEKDKNGCDECTCKDKPRCGRRPDCTSTTYCPHGFKKIDGCFSPKCECNEATCPTLTCPSGSCPDGFLKDSTGPACPTCNCKTRGNSIACNKLPCLSDLKCPKNSSPMKRGGCPVCVCDLPRQCPELICSEQCPLGVVQVDGCDTCECRTPAADCPALTCQRTSCRRGFASDADGCPTCECKSRRSSGGAPPAAPSPAANTIAV